MAIQLPIETSRGTESLFADATITFPFALVKTGSDGVPGLSASFSMLAGGLAQLVISSILTPINDMTQQALNLLTAHSLVGTFWTPTGGGSDATFPDPPKETTPDTFGFDKDLRLKSARMKALSEGALVDTLDPAFPHRAIPFSLSLLK